MNEFLNLFVLILVLSIYSLEIETPIFFSLEIFYLNSKLKKINA